MMPDLSPFADRMNDVEISANAPLTQTLMQRFGSNINFLLDFLGVTDGSSAPSGAINDLANAINLVDSHTMDLQVSIPSSGSAPAFTTIGTYTPVKFVTQIFYYVLRNDTGFSTTAGHSWGRATGFYATLNGEEMHEGIQRNPSGIFGTGDNIANDYVFGYNSLTQGDHQQRRFSSMMNVGEYATAFIPSGFRYTVPVCTLDWRDAGPQTLAMRLQPPVGNITAIDIYRGYVLDVKSAGF